MSDLFSFDLADGFASGRCPICHAVALDERRWLDSFWREGRRDRETRQRFFAGGGFCPRHAWLLHGLAVEADAVGAIADVYGGLADRDLTELDRILGDGMRRRRKGGGGVLARAAGCSACVAAMEALGRKVHFLLDLLGSADGRERYGRSAGLCLLHLQAALAAAGDEGETALYLVRDWRQRLAVARERLGDVRGSSSDVVRLYVGDPPPGANRG